VPEEVDRGVAESQDGNLRLSQNTGSATDPVANRDEAGVSNLARGQRS
jgi:hypothetical protein